jgi:pyridoxal phosphate-dependent aminotransferase EpsN
MSRIFLSPPHLGDHERDLLDDALDSNWIAPLGPHVQAFEEEFSKVVDVDHAVALSSGTAALHLALLVLGVREDDEVIVPTLTFAATANAVRYVGARPVFVDSERTSWNLDPGILEEVLVEKARRDRLPKAVIAVDLYGQCADYDRILPICSEFEVPVIEDAAEALGASYQERPAGSLGSIGAFSFNGNKIITTSGGGMLVSDRSEWIERALYLATQARDPAPHYQHSEVGYNYRLSNLLAAVGRGQLKHLGGRVAARRANNAFYRAALGEVPGIEFMPEIPNGRSTFWLSCIVVDPTIGSTQDAIRVLESENIEARPVWKPMHQQPAFVDFESVGGSVADDLFDRGLCLPSGSNLSDQDRERIVAALRIALPGAKT